MWRSLLASSQVANGTFAVLPMTYLLFGVLCSSCGGFFALGVSSWKRRKLDVALMPCFRLLVGDRTPTYNYWNACGILYNVLSSTRPSRSFLSPIRIFYDCSESESSVNLMYMQCSIGGYRQDLPFPRNSVYGWFCLVDGFPAKCGRCCSCRAVYSSIWW